MEEYTKKSIVTELNKYCSLAKDGDFVEITLWRNGEGFDIAIGYRQFSLSFGEFQAIKKLVKKLIKE